MWLVPGSWFLVLGSWFLVLGSWLFFESIGSKAPGTKYQVLATNHQKASSFSQAIFTP